MTTSGLLTRRAFACGVAATAGLAAAVPAFRDSRAQAQALIPVRFSLGFVVVGRYAPFYVAKAKGYYKDAGLDVSFLASQGGTAQSIQAIQSGIAEFATSDLAGLMVGNASGGSRPRMVAVYYQKPPYAIFSTDPGANITKLEDLVGKEIGTGAGSATPGIIKGLMRLKGLDADSVRFTNLDPSVRVAMLLSGKVPAIETFILGKPGIERNAGSATLRTLLLADAGLDLYSSGLIATEAYLAANPQVAKGFVEASLKGWRDSFKDPEEAATLMMEQTTGLTHQSIVDEVKIVRDLCVTPDTAANGLGTIQPERFRKGVEFLAQYGGFSKSDVDPDKLYSLDFLPKEPVKP